MGTEPAPKRKLLNYIDDRFTNNKELSKDREGEMRSKELKMIEKYSKKLAKEIESNDELKVMNNIIHRTTKETKKRKYRNKLSILKPPEVTDK